MIPSNFHILHFTEIESTNNYAQSHLKELSLPTFIYADYQSKGKGQQNNVWHSEPQKNLLSTIVLPVYLPIQKQYHLSQWISLIIIKVLVQLGISQDLIKIKWPNDILVKTNDGYKKISGILIENNIDNQIITTSIIGIGLNINQTNFQQLQKTATSVALLTQKNFSIESVIELLLKSISEYYDIIQLQKFNAISEQYTQYLLGWQTDFLFKEQNNIFKGKIIHLFEDGKIKVKLSDENTEKIYINKQIQFLL